jgi:acetyl esterase/lipase
MRFPGGALPSQVPPDIEAQLRRIGAVVAPPATALLYAPLQQKEPYAGVRVARHQAYGADARHLLDVFAEPPAAGGPPRPVLLFLHGGAFIGGERRSGDSPFYDNIALWAARHGMVGVNMTYRRAPQHAWPAAQHDLAAALAWLRENIGASGGDPARIVLFGHSAGAAHVAQYLAHPQFHATAGGVVAGAVLLSGLFDPSTVESAGAMQAYFGTDRNLYPQRSALPGLIASAVPLLLGYAELDPADFRSQGEQLHAALRRGRRDVPVLELLGHSHMSAVYAINTADHALTDALSAFVASLA